MVKRRILSTRSLGAEPSVPDAAVLADWVAQRRGTAGDITSYRIGQVLSPQVDAGLTFPCTGGRFYRDRIMECLVGIEKNTTVCEIGVATDPAIQDAYEIAEIRKGTWFAMPAPHVLGIKDTYYHDEDELSGAINGAYHSLMRSMRDAGTAGHVLICDRADEVEISALARQKVFFFHPDPDRDDLEVMLEHRREVAINPGRLELLLSLSGEYEISRLILLDADQESIVLALSHLDPDQVVAGGYCIGSCDTYWKDLVENAYYSA